MIGIYHNRDLDGFCSGAIMKFYNSETVLIGHDYGKEFDFSKLDGSPVIMADISMPMDHMCKVAESCDAHFTWIDHHISAIKDYEEFTGNHYPFCETVFDTSIAACEGTWKHLFPNKLMPLAVILLGEYDSWRNKNIDRWNNMILPFQYGMRLRCDSVDSFDLELFIDDDLCLDIIEEGKLILKYQQSQNAIACRSSFEVEFEGLRAICLNQGGANSVVFDSVYDESKHDIMIPFSFNGRNYKASIFTTKDDIDCSALAKKYGGGGHKKAAGFIFKDLDILIKQ